MYGRADIFHMQILSSYRMISKGQQDILIRLEQWTIIPQPQCEGATKLALDRPLWSLLAAGV